MKETIRKVRDALSKAPSDLLINTAITMEKVEKIVPNKSDLFKVIGLFTKTAIGAKIAGENNQTILRNENNGLVLPGELSQTGIDTELKFINQVKPEGIPNSAISTFAIVANGIGVEFATIAPTVINKDGVDIEQDERLFVRYTNPQFFGGGYKDKFIELSKSTKNIDGANKVVWSGNFPLPRPSKTAQGYTHDLLMYPADNIDAISIMPIQMFPAKNNDWYFGLNSENNDEVRVNVVAGASNESDGIYRQLVKRERVRIHEFPESVREFQKRINKKYDLMWSDIPEEKGKLLIVDKTTGLRIEGLTVDISDEDKPVWIRKYQFEDLDGNMLDIVSDGPITEERSIKIKDPLRVVEDQDNIVLSFPGWVYKDGEWMRKLVIGPDNKETKYPKYSTDEAITMILEDTKKIKEEEWEKATSNSRSYSGSKTWPLLGINGYGGVQYKGVKYPGTDTYVWNNIVVKKDSTSNITEETVTMLYAYEELRNSQSIIGWKINSGPIKQCIVEANLETKAQPLSIIIDTSN